MKYIGFILLAVIIAIILLLLIAVIRTLLMPGKTSSYVAEEPEEESLALAQKLSKMIQYDTTALITYQEQFNPPALQLRYDLRCTVPTPLFRTGTCQIDISGWYEALCQQFFHCLEKCHHRAFGIGRASPPYLSFRNISGKRCMGPLTLRRHYVLMAHEQDRLLRAFSLPVK